VPSSAELRAGHLVAGRYRIQQAIGRGGMGVVYQVYDEQLARKAALKLLLTVHANNAQMVERFQREARITASIGHPGIVDIHERGSHQGALYLVMEYLEGENLERRLSQAGPLPVPFVARVGTDLCSALAAAHAREIVHRDVKPSNVFLAEQGEYFDVVKVLDFGMAKLHVGERLTGSNQVFGTLAYMPPEQLTGSNKVTPASDTWAIGCVLYELLTGKTPFRGPSETAVGIAIMNDPPRPVRHARPDVPRALSDAIERALAKAPEDRYRNAGELGDALFEIADRLGALEPPRKRRSLGQSGANHPAGLARSARHSAPIAHASERTMELGVAAYMPLDAWAVAESERPVASEPVHIPTHGLDQLDALKTVVVVALMVMGLTLLVAWLLM
jgi:eukaryotic-like serine/threonine-protein kinase